MIEIEKENVVMRAGSCSVTLLPHLGGKISSILANSRELLQAPLAPLAPRTHAMAFERSDASGWDECLPSVAACTVEAAAGSVQVPDHGDLWRVAWETIDENQGSGIRDQNGTSVLLRGECFSLPLALERATDLKQTTDGWQLRLDYKLTNTGKRVVPWSWAAHPLFAVDSGDAIVLPSSVNSLRVEGSGGSRLGKADDIVPWPHALLPQGGHVDLSVVQSPESGIGDKLFAGPLAADANWCELHRSRAGLRIRVRFDSAATPYLGLWICYGGWPDRPGPRQNCVALEPATAPVDSLAQVGPWSRTLDPGQFASWYMAVDIQGI